MKSYGLCNFVESLFSYVVLIFRETLFTCFTWNYMMPSILKSQGVFKINVFSHCFPIKRKSSYDFVVTAWFLMWTSLGLNQGPPDYESVALTNWATSPWILQFDCKGNSFLLNNQIFWAFFSINQKNAVSLHHHLIAHEVLHDKWQKK